LLKRLQPYWLLFSNLAVGLGTLSLCVIRQVILPTRRRKGNLLSSLFVFFTSVVEQLIGFGEAAGRMLPTTRQPFAGREILFKTWVFSQKQLRLVVLIATWILFVLSFFEGAGSRLLPDEHVATRQEAGVKERESRKYRQNRPFVARWVSTGCMRLPSYAIPPSRWRESVVSHCDDRWRTLCVLRI